MADAAAPAPVEGSTARRSVLALVGLVGSAGLTFAALLVLVRTLSVPEYGLFALAFAVNQVAFIAADAGLASSSARALAAATTADERARIAGSAVAIKIVVALLVGALLALLAPVLADAFGEPELASVLRFTAVALAAQSVFLLFRHGLNAIGAASSMVRLALGESAIEALAVVTFAVAVGTAAGAMAGRAAGWIAGALLGLYVLRRHLGGIRSPSSAVVRDLVRYGLTLAAAEGAFLLFTQIDVLLIGVLLTAADVATFEAPARLLVIAGYLGYAVALAVAPLLAREQDERARRTLMQALRVVSVWQGAIVLGWLALVAPNAELIFGEGYGASRDVLFALTPYLLLGGVAPVLSLAANYAGAGRLVVVASCVALVLNAALDLAFLESEGVVAAAIATDVAFALFVALLVRGCADTFGFAARDVAAGATRLGLALVAPVALVLLLVAVGPAAAAAGVVPALAAYLVAVRAAGLLPEGLRGALAGLRAG